jgi:PAS domain-containing protein
MDPASDLERRYQSIFEHVPLGLWEEDYTAVFAMLDALKAQGVQDFDAYLAEHPEVVVELASRVEILEVNAASLEIFGARSKEELLGSLDRVLMEDSLQVFQEQLAAMARGVRHFSSETFARTLQGKRLWWRRSPRGRPPRCPGHAA